MLIQVERNLKKSSENRMFLIEKKNDLKSLQLSKEEQAYFKSEIQENKVIYTNQMGKLTLVGQFKSLKDDINKENTRKLGYQAYEIVKDKCASLEVISSNSKAIELFSEGLALSSYRFDKYLSTDRKTKIKLQTTFTKNADADLKTVHDITASVAWARDLVNEPLSYLTAEQFATDIKKQCEPLGVKVEIFEKQKIESLKMGGLLAVNKGSFDPPTFTVMEWKPKKPKNKKPIVLIGKGIVYDTGGLSLKPTAKSMDFMKSDMGGAAAMVGATMAIAKLELPLHIITLIPATDNRPGNNAYAPGDIIKMFDGTTVEVLNTDAEGRMVLADALAYSNKFEPELVVDAATLTGAAVAAVGTHASVSMGNAPQKELDALTKAGFTTFDRVVQFPFWEEYGEEMKSKIADLKNLGSSYAGMITAGKFLEHFTNYPYIHIDLAGPTYLHTPTNYRGEGGTGAGVRLIVEFLKNKSK